MTEEQLAAHQRLLSALPLRERKEENYCGFCGGEFTPKRVGLDKFCSKSCAAANRKMEALSTARMHPRAKLTNEQVRTIRRLHSSGTIGYRLLAKAFKCGESTIRDICKYWTRAGA